MEETELLTTTEVAQVLNCTIEHVRNLPLPRYDIGLGSLQRLRFRPSDIASFLESRKQN